MKGRIRFGLSLFQQKIEEERLLRRRDRGDRRLGQDVHLAGVRARIGGFGRVGDYVADGGLANFAGGEDESGEGFEVGVNANLIYMKS